MVLPPDLLPLDVVQLALEVALVRGDISPANEDTKSACSGLVKDGRGRWIDGYGHLHIGSIELQSKLRRIVYALRCPVALSIL